MIVRADGPFDVGHRGNELFDYTKKEWVRQPFVILRKATMEEFLVQCGEFGRPLEGRELDKLMLDSPYFYQVATD